jgi:predicted bacteriocin transport accessory protein
MKTPTFFFALFIFIPLVLFAQSNTIDIDQITEKIKSKEKHSMVFFHMERCPYCKKLLKNALSDEEVKKKIVKDYILIDVNVDKAQIIQYKDFTGNAKEFCKHLSIGYYPTVVFIDDNNEIVYSMKGYRKTATFNHILDYVTKKNYLETDFGGYLFDIDEVE